MAWRRRWPRRAAHHSSCWRRFATSFGRSAIWRRNGSMSAARVPAGRCDSFEAARVSRRHRRTVSSGVPAGNRLFAARRVRDRCGWILLRDNRLTPLRSGSRRELVVGFHDEDVQPRTTVASVGAAWMKRPLASPAGGPACAIEHMRATQRQSAEHEAATALIRPQDKGSEPDGGAGHRGAGGSIDGEVEDDGTACRTCRQPAAGLDAGDPQNPCPAVFCRPGSRRFFASVGTSWPGRPGSRSRPPESLPLNRRRR